MSTCGNRWPLVVLFLVAVLLRLAAIHWLAATPQRDELDNHRLAVTLLAGEGYAVTPGHPTTSLPPVYPAFIASVYALSRPDYRIVWYVQALLNASLVFLLFHLGRLLFSESVGYLAAGAHALHPSFEIVTTLYRENLLILLLVALCYCLVWGIKEDRSGLLFLAGGATGLLVLTNPIYLFLPLSIIAGASLDRRLRPCLRRLLVVALVPVVMWLPWQARNSLHPEGHAEADSYRHFTLMFGHYPVFSGDFWWTLSDMRRLEAEREQAREFLRQREQADVGRPVEERLARDSRELIDRILHRPFAYLRFVVNRDLILLVSPPPGSSALREWHPVLGWVAFGGNALFVLVSVLSLLRRYQYDATVFPFIAVLTYLLIVYGLIHAIRRYGYVLEPMWCVFGSAALYRLGARLKQEYLHR